MAADVLHVRFGVPYSMSSALWAVALLVLFVSWQQTEKTLSFHTIDTLVGSRSTGRPWWRLSRWGLPWETSHP